MTVRLGRRPTASPLLVAVALAAACAGGRSAADLADRPVQIPRDSEPELLNLGTVLAGMSRAVRVTGRTGPVDLFLLVDRKGRVHATRTLGDADDPVLEAMARTVARVMRFSPARREGDPVSVWIFRRLAFRWGEGLGGAGLAEARGDSGAPRLPPIDSVLAEGPSPEVDGPLLDLGIRESEPLIVLDGVPLTVEDELRRLRGIRLEELCFADLLSPEEAIRRFGSAGEHGAVLVVTDTCPRAEREDARAG